MNKVAAVIINRNTREFLRGCLESIAAQEFEGHIGMGG